MTVTGSLNNALTFLPDNRLLAADASGTLKVIDPIAKTVTNIGIVRQRLRQLGRSGRRRRRHDVRHLGDERRAAAASPRNNLLITVNTSTGTATPIGPTGFGNVFGIAYYGSRVIAFTGSAARIIEINPSTGAGTLLATHSHAYFGGTTSPLIPINGCM